MAPLELPSKMPGKTRAASRGWGDVHLRGKEYVNTRRPGFVRLNLTIFLLLLVSGIIESRSKSMLGRVCVDGKPTR